MTSRPARLLLVEDNPDDVDLLHETLREAEAGFELEHCARLKNALQRLSGENFDAVLLDLGLPDAQGLDTFLRVRSHAPHVPIVVLTGLDDESLAVTAVREGAQDYLVKGQLSADLLVRAIRYAIERKRAELSLRESNALLDTLVQNIPDAVFVKDLEGRHLIVNRAGAELVEMRMEEMLGKTAGEIFPSDLAEECTRSDEETKRERRALSFEESFVDKQGAKVFLETIKTPLYDSRRNMIGIVGISRNTSRRKLVEEELVRYREHLEELVRRRTAQLSSANENLRREILEHRRAREEIELLKHRNELILSSAGEGILGLDMEGSHTFVNPAATRMLGYESHELIGKRGHSLYHHTKADGSVHPEEECPIYGTLKDGAGCPLVEDVFGRKDGALFPVQYSSMPIIENDRTVGAVVTFRDITERKKLEEAEQKHFARISLLNTITLSIAEHQEMKSIFRVVMQHLEDKMPIDFGSVCLYDAANHSGRFLVRGAKSRPLAMELGTPEGASISISPEGGPINAGITHGEVVYVADLKEVEEPYLRKLAGIGISSMVLVPLVVEGRVFGGIGAARFKRDGFTEEEVEFLRILGEHVSAAAYQAKLHEDLLRAYNELGATQQAVLQQERLRALGQMASGIVHDINNALGPILGYADMLLEFETGLSDRVKRDLKTIRTAAGDITHIIAGMREFYRKRDEQDSLAPVNLNCLVKQVVDLTRPRWKDMPQEHGIVVTVDTECQKDLPLLAGIESEIREAVTNLVLNAVDALPGGGKVTLRTSASKERIMLEVIDTGTGMDEKTRRHCLEPFYTTKGDRGTGLGLAMVYGIMQRHDGDIAIETRTGKGTTLRLLFPIRDSAELASTAAKPIAPLPSLSILCIDDESAQRGLIRDMLTRDRHTVEAAVGGQAGLDRFRSAREEGKPFDLVITDLGMPYVDGREVARTIKAESPETPVILLTGWGTRMQAEGQMPSEVDCVVSKPATVVKLREALRRLIGKS